MKSCKSCGCVNDNINRYCRNCGSPFENTDAPAPVRVKAPEPSEPTLMAEAPAYGTPVHEAQMPQVSEPECPYEAAELLPDAEPAPWERVSEYTEPDYMDSALDPCDVENTQVTVLFDGDVGGAEPEMEYGYIDLDAGDEADPLFDPLSEAVPTEEKVSSVTVMKRVGSSATAAFFALFVTAFLASCCLCVLFGGVKVEDLTDFFYILGAGRMSMSSLTVYARVALLFICGAVIPSALFLVPGAWLNYAFSCTDKPRVLTGGLSLVGVASTFELMCSLAGEFFGILLLSGGLVTLPSMDADIRSVVMPAVIFLSVCCAVCLCGIIYSILSLVALGRLKSASRGGEVNHRMPVYLMLVNLLTVVALGGGVGYFIAGGQLLPAITCLLGGVCEVLLTALLIKYRTNLKEI